MTSQAYSFLKTCIVGVVVSTLGVYVAHAQIVHEQTPGSSFLYWEGEGLDPDTQITDNTGGSIPQGVPFIVDKSGSHTTVPTGQPVGTTFTGSKVLTKGTNPSGGLALLQPNGGPSSGPFAFDWTYHLKFAEAGTYTFFERFSLFERISLAGATAIHYFQEDAFFLPCNDAVGAAGECSFGTPGNLALPNNQGNSDIFVRPMGGADPFGAEDGFFWGEGRFHWQGGSLEDHPLGTFATFEVTPAQVGQELTLTLSNREIGTIAFDSFLLTKDPTIAALVGDSNRPALNDLLNEMFNTPELQGDLDWDFDVDVDDIAWFDTALNNPAAYEAEFEIPGAFRGDFNGSLPNPILDSTDIAGFVQALFGNGVPANATSDAVPEPTSAMLLILGSLVCGVSRRRMVR